MTTDNDMPRVVLLRCVRGECRSLVSVDAAAYRASCPVCGHSWPWHKSRLIRMKREAAR